MRRIRNHRFAPYTGSGLLAVDKPAEWTSFDVVNFVRSNFNIPKVGHCGTLDPAATGLLVLVVGEFTRFSQHLSGEDKTYLATMLLGTETDSQDLDGQVTATNDYSQVTEEQVRTVAKEFTGDIMQTPPMVSAVKKDGKKLYELARKGIEVEREPRPITIKKLEITRFEAPEVDMTVECSKGTYIRTLCADMGQRLGCGATLKSLRRTQSGRIDLTGAVKLEELKELNQEQMAELIAAATGRFMQSWDNKR